jgi:type II secretory pathway pseudopilin PulG
MNRRMNPRQPKTGAGSGEDGYILIAVLFMVAMVLIMLSIAAPKIAADIERDREIELQHRGHQFERAIKLYYKKFGAYPPNMEALEKSNEIRFLRKRYVDPATGKAEWHMIHFGENKTPTAMGFFGQPLGGVGGSTLAGIGPGGMGSGGMGQNAGGSAFGNNANGSGNAGLSDPNAGNAGNTGNTGSGNAGPSTDPNAPGTSGTGTNAGGSTFGSNTGTGNNQTFGGGGIIGVESTSPKVTILEYKKKKHFNEWEFVYDPQADRIMISGNTGTIGTPVGSGGIQSPGSSGLNSNGGGGSNPNGGGGIPPLTPNQPTAPAPPSTPPQ